MASPSTSATSRPDHRRVLVTDQPGDDGLAVLAAAPGVTVEVNTDLTREQLRSTIGDFDALIVRSGTQVTADIIQAAKRLTVIGRAGVGTDNIDLAEAERHGIAVVNTPDANTTATAEHTFALLLAAARNVAHAHRSLAHGNWDRSRYTGTELANKTLGVVGFGRVGQAVARRAQGFDMTVAAFDPYADRETATSLGVTLGDLDSVLRRCDYLTLHTTLTDQTRHLINADTLAAMKPSAILVNAARGDLIDTAAVADALDAGRLRGAAVDVYTTEPPGVDDRLIGHPKVVHTPHLGASTSEAQRAVSIDIAEQILDALRTSPSRDTTVAASSQIDSQPRARPRRNPRRTPQLQQTPGV